MNGNKNKPMAIVRKKTMGNKSLVVKNELLRKRPDISTDIPYSRIKVEGLIGVID